MASFQPRTDQTPFRSRRDQNDRSLGLGRPSGALPLRDVTQSRSSSAGFSAVCSRMQQQEDQLEEMKLRQQLLEEQLDSIRQENVALLGEVKKVKEKLKDPEREKRQRLPGELSHRVREIHKSLSDDEQYDTALSITVRRNLSVREHLLELLLEACSEKFSSKNCKAAATNLYNNLRRQFRECQPNHEDRIELQNNARKKRSRQQRKFNRRKKKVNQDEKEYFSSVRVSHMTEEESDGEGGFIEREISWRSEDYNKFLQTLDGRVARDRPVGATILQRSRRAGTPSTAPIPDNLPTWMIKPAADVAEQAISTGANLDTSNSFAFNRSYSSSPEPDLSRSSVHTDVSDHCTSTPTSDSHTPVANHIGATQSLLDELYH